MVISVLSFTKNGLELQKKLTLQLKDFIILEKPENKTLYDWISWCFMVHIPVVFIGACGIAVRTIAPFVKDKLSDSAVLVIDEKAQFVIPVLSGHVGGANQLASLIAKKTGSVSVITTATDINNKFSVDVFAQKNGLRIENRDGIKKVSEKVLNNEKITFWISPEISLSSDSIPENVEILQKNQVEKEVTVSISKEENRLIPGILNLSPKDLCLGLGCKKGKTFEELKAFVEKTLTSEQIKNISCVASIDLKKSETGIQLLSQYYNVPFLTYSASQLEKASLVPEAACKSESARRRATDAACKSESARRRATDGACKPDVAAGPEAVFSSSDFVKKITGVSNVCERSAVLAAGNNCGLILKKTWGNGITLALSQKKAEITFKEKEQELK